MFFKFLYVLFWPEYLFNSQNLSIQLQASNLIFAENKLEWTHTYIENVQQISNAL